MLRSVSLVVNVHMFSSASVSRDGPRSSTVFEVGWLLILNNYPDT